MNKKIMLTAIGAQAFLSLAYAQETILQPLPATIMPVSQTQTGDTDPNGTGSSCLNLATDLRYKMKDAVVGGDVSDLQDFFISVNLMQGESTGYFGAGTLKAVKFFQQKQGLNPTGFVGPLTRAKVNTLSCNIPSNVGDGPQGTKPQRQMPDGTENDLPKRQFDASSTFPGMLNGFPPKRHDDGKSGQDHSKQENEGRDQNTKRVPQPETSVLTSYISDTDKQALKTKEDAMKSADEALKTYYLSVRGGTMTDDAKAKLGALESAAKQAHKDLEDTRKTIFENLKNTLTDAQKQKIEMTMKLMQQGRQEGSTGSIKNERKESGDTKKGKSDQVRMKMPPQREGGYERGGSETQRSDKPHDTMPPVSGEYPHVIIADCSKGPC